MERAVRYEDISLVTDFDLLQTVTNLREIFEISGDKFDILPAFRKFLKSQTTNLDVLDSRRARGL